MICEKCKKEFFEDWRKDKETRKTTCRFCSIECANSRIRTEELRKRVSAKLKRIPDRFCSKCGKNKLMYNNVSGLCKDCKPPAKTATEIITKHRQRRKIFLVEHKGGKCEKCGETRPWILHFHHLNPKEKLFALAKKGTTKSIERDLKEVDKCILLCSNCHGDFNYQNHWNKITIEEYLNL